MSFRAGTSVRTLKKENLRKYTSLGKLKRSEGQGKDKANAFGLTTQKKQLL